MGQAWLGAISSLSCLDDVSVCLRMGEHRRAWWGWARSCLSLSGLMCLDDVFVCLSMGTSGAGSCLMCLHDVSVCFCVSEHGRAWWGCNGLVCLCLGILQSWLDRLIRDSLSQFFF